MTNIDLSLLSEKELNKIIDSENKQNYCEIMIGKSDSAQNSIKVNGINSYYGATGTPYFQFYNPDMAESVTSGGKALIQYVMKCIDLKLNDIFNTQNVKYVVGGDTDSAFVSLNNNNDFTREEIIKIYEVELQKTIDESFNYLYETTNAFDRTCLEMGLDMVADKGFIVSKKNYLFDMIWDEKNKSLDDSREKMSGLEAVKASKYSASSRNFMKKCYRIILDNDNDKLIEYCRAEFDNFKQIDINDLAYMSKVNNIHKYDVDFPKFPKRVPINSKAAISHNYHIEKMDIGEKYDLITEGDSVRFVRLLNNNPLETYCIAWLGDKPPEEFQIPKYVDWRDLFYKNMLKPVERVTKAVGWDLNLQSMTQLSLL